MALVIIKERNTLPTALPNHIEKERKLESENSFLWIKTTALPQMLNFNPEALNDDKLYYELNKIEANKESLENFLFNKTYQLNPESYNYINYNLTTSYFVGIKCSPSQLGKSKDNQPYRRQVILAIMVDEDGYPFKWDILPGDTAEVATLEDKVNNGKPAPDIFLYAVKIIGAEPEECIVMYCNRRFKERCRSG